MIKVFFRDSIAYVFPSIVSRGLSLFLVPLYTRVLSPADYGALDLLTVFAVVINLTIALEVTQGVARFYASEKDLERRVLYASSAFWFTIVVYSIFTVVAFLFTTSISPYVFGRTGMDDVFQCGIIYIWASGLFNLVQNQFRWELRSRQFAVVSLLLTISTAGISILLAYVLNWGLIGLVAGMTAGSLLAIALGIWWLRFSFPFRIDLALLREMLTFSSPLVFSGIAIWAGTYMDRLMLNHFLSVSDVGVYGIGYRIASVAGLVMAGFQGALTPLVYKYHTDPEMPRNVARIFRVCVALSLLVFAGLSLFSGQIVRLMTTELFYDGAAVVIYLTPAIILGQMYIFMPGISLKKKNHLEIYINLAGLLLNIAFGVALIPHVGVVGAGLSTLLSCIGIFLMRIFFSQRLFPIPFDWPKIISAVFCVCTLVAMVSCLRLEGLFSWIVSLLAGVCVLLVIVATRLICPDEFRNFLSKIRGN